MPDQTSQYLSRLQDNLIPGLDLGNEIIYPKYENQSIVNIPSTVCEWMDLPRFGSGPLIPEIIAPLGSGFRRVILLLIDGLALHRFIRWMEIAPVWKTLVQDGVLAPLTSVVPSTTSSALTSLWTGVSPASHGVIGYEMWLKEFSLIGNMITHAPITFRNSTDSLGAAGFSPDQFLSNTTFGTHLKEHGVKSYSYTHYGIANSGLSRMLMNDVEVVPFQTPASMWVSIRNLIKNKSNEKMYVWTYWGQVDGISHYHGPDDERTAAEFSHYSSAFQNFFLDQLNPTDRAETLLILTADHGQTSTPLNSTQVLANHPGLNQHLRMKPTCENRLAFLYLRPCHEDAVREYFSQTWPDRFDLLSQDDAVDNGLFGPGDKHPDLTDRVGDLIVVARDDAYLWWANEDDFLRGRHGGLNPHDMLVPFLAVRL
jgi:hypothetical protein